MLKPTMIENQKNFSCFQKHNLPIISIQLNPNLSRDQRFLCAKCLEYIDFDANIVGLQKVIELISERQNEKMELVQRIINHPIKIIEVVFEQIQELKSKLFEQFGQLINILSDWILNLKQKERSYSQYSFYEQLENLQPNQENTEAINKKLLQEIQQINQSYKQKVFDKLKKQNQLQNYETYYQQLSCFELDYAKQHQDIENLEQQINKKSQIKIIELIKDENKVVQEEKINFKLIDQSVKSNAECCTIAFNSSGSIMISNEEKDIKVWSFNNGIINLISTLTGHSDWIYCLIFSKKLNSFISSSGDNTIRCWKQINLNDWISSKPYQHHAHWVMCLILNSNEDLLFSGSSDKSIIVWKVDLNKNELFHLYSLNKHNNTVASLSLNQSETYLVSCAVDNNSIIVWKTNQNDKFEFKYFVNQSIQSEGLKVKFLKEDQFIWITGGQELDQVFVFELEEGIFSEKQQKTISLRSNNKVKDEYHFPIIQNKERKFILIRHKTFIYIIRETKNGMYQIVNQQNCDSDEINGMVTDNGKYLVYWNSNNKNYSAYELQNI